MTNEESERNYEEEKAHADARSRLEHEKKAEAAEIAAKNTMGRRSGANDEGNHMPPNEPERTTAIQAQACPCRAWGAKDPFRFRHSAGN
jgi:hypothetical protein